MWDEGGNRFVIILDAWHGIIQPRVLGVPRVVNRGRVRGGSRRHGKIVGYC